MKINKKNFFILLFAFILITLYLYNLLVARYALSMPMKDLEYKKAIIQKSHNIFYRLEPLNILVGESELSEFIRNNDKNSEIYISSNNNVENGIFKANLHMHTTNSDGSMTVEELLDQAQKYGETLKDNEYMLVAITDHNTVNGAKDVIKVIEKNYKKYNKIKVVVGIEIFTQIRNGKKFAIPVDIHVLTLCINPYDEFLNKEFHKTNLKDRYNRKLPDRDFDNTILTMTKYGLVGVAHPARYLKSLKNEKYVYMDEMLQRYLNKCDKNKIAFTEAYYQSYDSTTTPADLGMEYDSYKNYIKDLSYKKNILRTGSTDTHGYSIFHK